jgi:acyl carrier protein
MDKNTASKELLNYINNTIFGRGSGIEIDENTQLFEDRLINSLKIIELIAFLEKKFRIKVDDQMVTMENFKSVKTMVDKFLPYEKGSKSKRNKK